MKIVPLEQNGTTLPDELKWITPGGHQFKDLLYREIDAIEEQIDRYEILRKTIIKRRKQEEKNYFVIKALCRALESSIVDPPSKRYPLFKKGKRSKGVNEEENMDGKKIKARNFDDDDDDEEKEDDEGEDDEDDRDEKGKDGESGKEEHKKRKYIILLKKCECCGLEVKRHICKHTLCAKPCSKEEKQLSKKKDKKEKGTNRE